MKVGDVVCIKGAHSYSYRGAGRNWKRASDEYWDATVNNHACGKYIGSRRIDGVQCAVLRDDRFGDLLAATKQNVRVLAPSKGRVRK